MRHCTCGRTEAEMKDCPYGKCAVSMDETLGALEAAGSYNGVPLYVYHVAACGAEGGKKADTPTPVDPAPVFASEEDEFAYLARRMREIMAEEGRVD